MTNLPSYPQTFVKFLLSDNLGCLDDVLLSSRSLQPLHSPVRPMTGQSQKAENPNRQGQRKRATSGTGCVLHPSPWQRVFGQPDPSILQRGGAFVVPCLLALSLVSYKSLKVPFFPLNSQILYVQYVYACSGVC